mmetsp:Transcript_22741/g.37652  ORF Transcript_22741/g.37652 Transcript_22741/m.37652 type:complete len:151 (-) Transcript_22741:102-554(-)|eukprot:CAMPEP_0119013004 /NCGR_PEP_ID=MMETSP1176-20130426/7744_1 /TAXON_ID=265551 /ORGANISM="Synedropsis recta cf, Strain CCMP1620" /LENGTH=150 /DNA_ID=CAMNT_0006966049 /DNA_START=21 /DNA_END=473 /DNA_ORIENTATION=-
MNSIICTVALLLIQGAESFVPPASFIVTGTKTDSILPSSSQLHASDFGLTSTLQLSTVDDLLNNPASGIFIPAFGLFALSVVLVGLTFVMEKMAGEESEEKELDEPAIDKAIVENDELSKSLKKTAVKAEAGAEQAKIILEKSSDDPWAD